MIKRSSTVVWHGTGKEGSGKVSTESTVIENSAFAYNTRFLNEKGTNPEELIAAAHASCFTMKLSFVLNENNYTADTIETKCTVSLDKGGIKSSHLVVKAKVHDLDDEEFQSYAEKTMNECPVSKALSIEITMEATLVDEHSPDETFKL
ncbi:MAG: peroxiredoxin, OsmC subfamily [Bacteroidetes bacterium]|jgi:osmotically inducible protein OsmC|nr:peroxiredoxin, OsmC subfamily [Bacteroidota bacterium]